MSETTQYQLPPITKQGLDVLAAALDVTVRTEGLKFVDIAKAMKDYLQSAQEIKEPTKAEDPAVNDAPPANIPATPE
jgi:hypothetical protein